MKKVVNEEINTPKSKKSVLSRVLNLLVYALLIGIFLFSGYHVLDYVLEGKKQSDLNQSMIEEAITERVPNESGEEALPSTQIDSEILKDPVLMLPDISVDLQKIKSQYSGVVGWIYSPNTVLNYPVMQASNNQYYVDRLPNGAYNANGSLFLDCRNQADLSAWNHIIYGHNMINRSMFGILMDYRSQDYFSEHPYLFYFTESGVYRLEIFAGIHTTATSLFYTFPQTEEAREAYLLSAKTKSILSSDVSVSASDSIMVLSTCSGRVNEDKRFIVIAKIVPLDF